MNFYKLYEQLRVAPPVKYDLADYRDFITSQPDSVGNEHEKPSNYGLRPITDDDMLRYAVRDEDWMNQHNKVYDLDTFKMPHNPQFGSLMTDEELKKWYGNPK